MVGWTAKTKQIKKIEGPVIFRATIYLVRKGNAEGDIDNYAKTLKDALNGIAWIDDRQVVESHMRKAYVRSQAEERVEIEIEEAAEG